MIINFFLFSLCVLKREIGSTLKFCLAQGRGGGWLLDGPNPWFWAQIFSRRAAGACRRQSSLLPGSGQEGSVLPGPGDMAPMTTGLQLPLQCPSHWGGHQAPIPSCRIKLSAVLLDTSLASGHSRKQGHTPPQKPQKVRLSVPQFSNRKNLNSEGHFED